MSRARPLAALALLSASVSVWPAAAEPVAGDGFTARSAAMTVYAVDEFDGVAGTLPSEALWNFDTGGGGWGNGEQQTYTEDPRNVSMDGRGNLAITALEDAGTITSARINTKNKADLTQGMVAARIRFPQGAGIHPAFWMLGNDIDTAGYPECGEIDIVELINAASHAYFTVHGPTAASTPEKREHWQAGASADTPDLSTDFHIYWLDKRAGELVIGIDDAVLAEFTPDGIPQDAVWVMDSAYFAILNLAVGGSWPGPLGAGVLPQTMLVDWIKFYR